MKKFLLFLFAVLAVAGSVFAQDYAPFRIGHTPYFQAGDSIYSLRITNAFIQGSDSVFEFNQRVLPLAISISVPGCFGVTTATHARTDDNLFGRKMVKTSAGDFQFFVGTGNIVLLKPLAGIGSNWVFSQALQLTATMQSKTVGMVNGLPDSIAVISISNGDQIQISRTYGLVEGRSFYSYFHSSGNVQPLTLVRLPENGIGNAINHAYRIFDFQVGDKFLHKGSHRIGFPPCYEYLLTTEVLSRNQNQDSIWYELRKQKLITAVPGAPLGACGISAGTTLYPFETVLFVVKPSGYQHLADLSSEFTNRPAPWAYSPNSGFYQSAFYNRMATFFETLYPDTCSGTYHSVPDAEGYSHFAEALGLVKWHADMAGSEELIAYIKGSETYGTWAPLTGVSNQMTSLSLKVFPNPFSSDLTIQLPEGNTGQAQVSVFDGLGRVVHQQAVSVSGPEQQFSLAMQGLPAGLYMVKLQQGEKSYSAKVQRQ